MKTQSQQIEIYSAGRQLIKVRGVCYGIYLLSPVLFWAGWLVLNSPPEHPNPTELQQHFPLIFGLLFMLMAVSFAAGIANYQYCYVSVILFDAARSIYIIKTENPVYINQWEMPLESVVSSDFRHGEYSNIKFTIQAPWYKLKIRNRRFSFIIDLQGDIKEEKLFNDLLRGA